MKKPVYLDYLATTPVDPRVAEAMSGCLTLDGVFGNPASRSHRYGWEAEMAVENARRDVADLIGADPREIVWTSGATESDNLAIKGVALRHDDAGHIVTSAIEHKAVLDTCAHLETLGWQVTYLAPDAGGRITPAAVAAALQPDTRLVSIMHANNEIGTVNDIAAIAAVTREAGVPLHVDAAQSAGKLPLDVSALQVDLLSLSAHKMYGPKGVGALYVRRQPRVHLQAQIHGGGHERGMRAGTLATHQVVGMGTAARLAAAEMPAEAARLQAQRDRLWSVLQALGDVQLNGDPDARLPGALNVSFGGVEGETLLLSLNDLAVSTGSACTSASLEPSYVLRALGVPDQRAHSSLRLSLGRFTTDGDVDYAAQRLCECVQRLRGELSHAAS
ncbi:MAG: IscS subfamily cysteine desulfurase [Chromatocurvus sp.]